MAEQNVTTKFIADVSEFKSGIAQANQAIKLANAEFKAASAGLDNWENSVEGLQAKLKQLEKVIESENKKLKAYKDQLQAVEEAEAENAKRAEEIRKEYQKAVEQFGKNSEEAKKLAKALTEVEKEQASNSKAADKLRITILNQTGTVNKAEKEHRQYTKALEDVETADERAAKAAEEAAQAAEKKAKEIEDAKREAEEAARAEKKLEEASRDLSGGFSVAKAAVADFISDGLQKLISMCWDGVKSLTSLADETQEYREDMSKLEVAFEKGGHSAKAASKVYEDFYGILGESDRSIEAANHLAKFVENEKELADWTKIVAGVTAEFGDSIPIEGLTEAANETARLGELTGPLGDAINWASDSTETFGVKLKANTSANKKWNDAVKKATSTEDYFKLALQDCSNEQERNKLITETLLDLYGESGETYSEMNKSIIESRKATARYNDALAELGETAEPVVTEVKNGFADILEEVNKLIKNVDTDKIKKAISDGFTYFIDEVIPAVIDGFKWIKDNWQDVATGISIIAGSFIAFKSAMFVVDLINKFTKFFAVIKGGEGVLAGLSTALGTSPIALIVGAVVAGIAVLAGAFATLWKNSEEFREKMKSIWEEIKGTVKSFCDGIVDRLNSLGFEFEDIGDVFWTIWKGFCDLLAPYFEGVFQYIADTLEVICDVILGIIDVFIAVFSGDWEGAWEAIKGIFVDIWKYIKDWFKNILNVITQTFDVVCKWFGTTWEETWNTIKTFVINIWNSIKAFFTETIPEIINNIVEWFKSLPGKIQIWLSDVVSKIRTWAVNLKNQAYSAASTFVNSVIEWFKSLPGKIQTWLSDVISKIKSWGTDMVKQGKAAAQSLVDTVVNKIKELPGKMASIGSSVVEGIWNGISDKTGWIANKISGFVGDVESWFKDFFGINSPSKLMRDSVGKSIPEGIAVGIRDNVSYVKNAIGEVANTAKASVNGADYFTSSGSVNTGGMVFNQYNYSPKSLSRLEIYRQTQNQLRFASKGVT